VVQCAVPRWIDYGAECRFFLEFTWAMQYIGWQSFKMRLIMLGLHTSVEVILHLKFRHVPSSQLTYELQSESVYMVPAVRITVSRNPKMSESEFTERMCKPHFDISPMY